MALRFIGIDPDTGQQGSPTIWVDQEMRDSYGVGDEAEDFENWRRTGQRDVDPASNPGSKSTGCPGSAPNRPWPDWHPPRSRPCGSEASRTRSTRSDPVKL